MFRRALSLVGALVALVALAACGHTDEADTSTDDSNEVRDQSIDHVEKKEIPLREVSGLGARKKGGRTQYLAIGDADKTLVTFSLSGTKIQSVESHDIARAVSRSSQWEAVAGDGKGRVFILEEAENRIIVLDEDLGSVIHTIKLDPGFRDDASGGEGMLLLANGHVLLAKEKDPAALIELAPRGEDAQGYSADLALGDKAFPLGRGATSELTKVHEWSLGASESARFGDISDLAVDEENRILFLSDQGRAIIAIERTLDPSEGRIDAKQIYSLPRSVDKPEGLVIANGRPIVAIDQSRADKESLFVFNELPGAR